MKNNKLNLMSIINDAKVNNLRNFSVLIRFNAQGTGVFVNLNEGGELLYSSDFKEIDDIKAINKANKKIKKILLKNKIEKSEIENKIQNDELIGIAFDIMKITKEYKHYILIPFVSVTVASEYFCAVDVSIYKYDNDSNEKHKIYSESICHIDHINKAIECKRNVLNILQVQESVMKAKNLYLKYKNVKK